MTGKASVKKAPQKKPMAGKPAPAGKPRPTIKTAPPAQSAAGLPLWFKVFLGLLALAPLPFASNRPWASDLMALVTGGLLLWMLAAQGAAPSPSGEAPRKRLLAALTCFSLVLLWSLIQILPFTPDSWHHPVWSETAAMLANPSGAIALDPGLFPESLLRLLTYAGCFLLALSGARETQGAKALVGTLAFAGGVYALYGLIVYSSGSETILWFDKWAYFGFLTSTFVNKNSYATYAGLGLLCSLAVCWRAFSHLEIKDKALAQRSRGAAFFAALEGRHYALAALPVLLLAALVLTGSRAGIACSLGGVLSFFLLLALNRRGRLKKGLSLAALVAGLFLLFVMAAGDGLTSRLDAGAVDSATSERMAAYKLATTAIADNPWLGFGLGSFDSAFRLYRDSSLPVWFHHAHNDYLEMMMDLGVPAALLLFAAIGLLLSCCAQGVWQRKRDAAYPALALAASAVLLSHSFVDFGLHIPAIAASFAALLGMGVAQSWSSRLAPGAWRLARLGPKRRQILRKLF